MRLTAAPCADLHGAQGVGNTGYLAHREIAETVEPFFSYPTPFFFGGAEKASKTPPVATTSP